MKNEARETGAIQLNAAPADLPPAAPHELSVSTRESVEAAARAVESAEALLFTAGAGLGVD